MPSQADVVTSDSSAPFGPLDPDVKAYFRTVDEQLRDWQHGQHVPESEPHTDPNEERRMFFTAALSEMNGKELRLAADPECSPVLERMIYSMDDFVRRVFTDRLATSWLSLMKDRFASHVCQTLFTVVADTIARESRGIIPSISSSPDNGELLTMTQHIVNVCEDIIPELPSLVHDPFASHVLRALLLLLAPGQLTSNVRPHKYAPFARSKKSASWKARIGPMKAVIPNESDMTYSETPKRAELPIPEDFSRMAREILRHFREALGGNEVRALAVDKVASPVLQMFLELEVSLGQAESPDSIMNRLLEGLVSETNFTPSPYVSGLFVNPISSHLAESLVSHCSSRVFVRLWDCYFADTLTRLSTHPVANFVVARGVERLDVERFQIAISRLHGTWKKSRNLSHFGVLKALVDRANHLNTHEAVLVETICSMFELSSGAERKDFLQCVLRLKTMSEYQDALSSRESIAHDNNHNPSRASHGSTHNLKEGKQRRDHLEPMIQGSLLLQSVLRLHEPHNSIVLESLHALLPDELLTLACSPTSSRILDVVFESSTVPLRSRKRLVTSFIGQFHLLVDDRIGSRVADRCWEAADPYLKEKIARSLIPHEHLLAGSYFGRFFFRKLRLPLMRRNPDQWKVIQSKEQKIPTSSAESVHQYQPKHLHPLADSGTAIAVLHPPKSNNKRKTKATHEEDEIDSLFSGIKKKMKKGVAALSEDIVTDIKPSSSNLEDSILQAIKSAPSNSIRRDKQ